MGPIVIAAVGRDTEVLATLLADEGIATTCCATLAGLCDHIDDSSAGAVVAEELLADSARPRLIETLASQPEWSDFPLIVLAVPHVRSPGWLALRQVAGSTHAVVVERPVRKVILLSAVRAALRSRARQLQVRNELDRRRRAEDALRRADARKDEFLATLSHELRNPLAPIVTGLELLKRMEDQAELETVRGTVERQVLQLVRLVDDLLDVSRITRGQLRLHRARTRLSDVIARAVEQCQSLIEEKGHRLVIDQPTPTLELHADSSRLTQVIANLLNNAARYTPGSGEISLRVTHQDDAVVIAVSDTGIGLPSTAQPGIFEMFGQVEHAERGASGLGVGLALAKSLVELHGGRIEASSEGADQGSEFRVTLPIVEELEPSVVATSPSEETAGDPPLRVLVVDDNQAAADMLAAVIRLMGHTVETAHDGRQAVDRAAEFRPDIAFMDLGMPVMNGYMAARQIRQQAWGRTMTLVALTGWSRIDDKRRTRDAGFDSHLIKPVSSECLRRTFAELKTDTTA